MGLTHLAQLLVLVRMIPEVGQLQLAPLPRASHLQWHVEEAEDSSFAMGSISRSRLLSSFNQQTCWVSFFKACCRSGGASAWMQCHRLSLRWAGEHACVRAPGPAFFYKDLNPRLGLALVMG